MLERLVDTCAPARAHSARVLARIAQDEVSMPPLLHIPWLMPFSWGLIIH